MSWTICQYNANNAFEEDFFVTLAYPQPVRDVPWHDMKYPAPQPISQSKKIDEHKNI